MNASATRLGKRTGAAILTGLLLCSAPPASADRDGDDGDRRGHRHQRYDDRHGGRHHQHGDWCAPRRSAHKHKHKHHKHAQPRYASWEGGWYGPRPVARARYRCEPCGHWYGEEATFHQHLYRQHSIARAVVPLVIGAAAFGWIFYGH